MKTLGLIFLITIYSLSSFGLGVEKFYCCGHLKSMSLSLISSEKNKCAKEGATSGCCKSKFQSLKVKDNHVLAVNSTLGKSFSFAPILNFYEPAGSSKTVLDFVFSRNYSPPLLVSSVPLYISNSVFRI